MHGSSHYGFGTLWMNWQRRGDFARLIRELRDKHRYRDEIKWTKAGTKRFHRFYLELVEQFFQTRWLTFHCIVLRKADVDKSAHAGSMDLARRKHFTMPLTNKIRRALKAQPKRNQTFRIWVDPIASRYAKADEAIEVIANNVLRKTRKERAVDSVITRDSKETPAIQLCDLLLGAVMQGWNQGAKSGYKLSVQRHVAEHLGWPDLNSDTHRDERKFNIWYFHDPTRGRRKVVTRQVTLLYPL